jgi:hypothetical protein
MSALVEHVFAVIGCITVAVCTVLGLCVALGIIKLRGTLTHHDDDE